MELGIIVSISSIVINLLIVIVGGYFGFYYKTNIRLAKIEAAGDINTRLNKIETANDIFWKVVDPHLASIIHSPVHVERDELVDKLIGNCINMNELRELSIRLMEMINEESGDKQLAGILLLARVKTKLADSGLKEVIAGSAKWYH